MNTILQYIDYFDFEDSIKYLKINTKTGKSRKSQSWTGKRQLSKCLSGNSAVFLAKSRSAVLKNILGLDYGAAVENYKQETNRRN